MAIAPQPYDRQVRPGTAAPLREVSGDAFGASVGRALSEVGQAGQQLDQSIKAADRNEQWADWSVKFEDAKAQAQADADERRAGSGGTAQPGYQGHADTVEGATRQRMDQLLEGLSDPVLRRQATLRVAAFTNDLVTRERGFELGQRVKKLGEDTRQIATLAGQRVLTSADVATDLPGAVGDVDAYIDHLDVAPDLKEGLRRELVPGVLLAGVQNRVNAGDLDTAEAMVKSPAFAELGASRTQQLLDDIAVERRRRDAAARADAAQARSQQREALATEKARLDTGAGVPADWDRLAAGYDAIGDTSGGVTARAKGAEMKATLDANGAPQEAIRAEIDTLTARRNSGGLSAAEASRLSGLQTRYQQNETRLNAPGGALQQLAFATGKVIAPLDTSDPASLASRADAAIAAARQYGRPNVEPLLPNEVTPLRELADGTPAQQMQALDVIAGFGKGPAVLGAARQVAPGQDGARFRLAAIQLGNPNGRAVAQAILRGQDALKANPGVLAQHQNDAREVFQSYIAPLKLAPSEYQAGLYDAATAYYAATANGSTQWDEARFRSSVETVLGAHADGQFNKGGTALFRGHRVVLPVGWTGDGLFKRLARIEGQDLGQIRVSGPGVWPDGSDLYSGQIRDLLPVWRGGTLYSLASPRTGRILQAKGGGDYVIDAAKVPWRD